MIRSTLRFFVVGLAVVVLGCGKSGEETSTTASSEGAASATTSNSVATKATAASPHSLTSATTAASETSPVATESEQGDPIVVLHTSLGNLYVRLFERKAPRSVANFLDYARTGHYDGSVFHQVEADFVAVGGAFDQKLQKKQVRYSVVNEATNGLKNVRGTLAMARDPGDANSATSMFFVNLADNPKLDHRGMSAEEFGYCVFGEVIDGLDVLKKLSAVPVKQEGEFANTPVERVVLNTVRRVREVTDSQVQQTGFNASSGPRR